MTTDIRIHTTFKNNRKKRKLFSKLGSDGVLSLIYLWLSVAENKPEGILTGYSAEDIELDSDWFGEPGLFVATLIDCNLLDCDEHGVYSLHNWATRQQWVFKSTDRSDKARFSRIAKTHPVIYAELKGKGVNAISKEDYASLTDIKRSVNEPLTATNDTLTPSPAPAPKPTPSPDPSPKEKELSCEFENFWDLFQKKKDHKKCLAKWKLLNQKEIDSIFQCVSSYVQSTPDPQFRKNPLTWLNGKCWNDEIIQDLNPAEKRLQSNINVSKEWLDGQQR